MPFPFATLYSNNKHYNSLLSTPPKPNKWLQSNTITIWLLKISIIKDSYLL